MSNFTFTAPMIQAMQDSAAADAGTESTWTTEVPEAPPSPLEKIMLAEDKLFVVLAVVLIIWFGVVAMLVRSDRKIKNLERRLTDSGFEASEDVKEGV